MANCTYVSTLVPLCDDPSIGLYGLGYDDIPPEYLVAMQQAGEAVVPRLRDGTVDEARGTIVLLCIGMSNASMTVTAMMSVVKTRKLNARVKIVNACQFGQDLRILADPNNPYWKTFVPSKLAAAGVTAAQVGAIWCMEGNKLPATAVETQGWWTAIHSNVMASFVNAKQFLVESVNFMGYSTKPELSEPGGYDQGVALRDWVVAQPASSSLVVSWGAYLWCAGKTPRQDGFTWLCPADCMDDGIHPSNPTGSTKLANLVVDRLLGSLDTSVWASP